MSYVSALYHVVFCTKHRAHNILLENTDILYKHLWSIINDNRCVMYKIGGSSNHVHILMNLHPDVCLSHLVREMKAKSSRFLSHHEKFKKFDGWSEGYYAGTLSYKDKEKAITYINDQWEHHGCYTFDDELDRMVRSIGMQLYPDSMNK